MASINDQSTLVGNFKDQYGPDLIQAFKFVAQLANKIKFDSEYGSLGQQYVVPVDLSLEHGFTATAAGVTPSGTGYLNPNTGQSQAAKVDAVNMHGRSAVAYEAIFKSQGDKRAFRSATEYVVKKVGLSGAKRIEVQLLHGQEGWGQIGVNPGNGASRVVTITDDSWSTGIWAGMKNMTLDLYTTGGVKQNTGSSATSNAPTITKVDPANKQLTISFAQVGDQTLNLANLLIFPETHSPTTEFAGLGKIGLNTGVIHNIDANQYELWGGNQYAVNGPMNFAKLLDGMSIPASFGLLGVTACGVISPKLFEVLNTDQAALKKYDVTYRPASAENGFEALVYHSQTGKLEVMSHPLQKDGRVNVFVPDESKRIGATDATMVIKDDGQEKIIFDSPNSPSKEMRLYSNQALFVEQPRHTVVFTGITY